MTRQCLQCRIQPFRMTRNPRSKASGYINETSNFLLTWSIVVYSRQNFYYIVFARGQRDRERYWIGLGRSSCLLSSKTVNIRSDLILRLRRWIKLTVFDYIFTSRYVLAKHRCYEIYEPCVSEAGPPLLGWYGGRVSGTIYGTAETIGITPASTPLAAEPSTRYATSRIKVLAIREMDRTYCDSTIYTMVCVTCYYTGIKVPVPFPFFFPPSFPHRGRLKCVKFRLANNFTRE